MEAGRAADVTAARAAEGAAAAAAAAAAAEPRRSRRRPLQRSLSFRSSQHAATQLRAGAAEQPARVQMRLCADLEGFGALLLRQGRAAPAAELLGCVRPGPQPSALSPQPSALALSPQPWAPAPPPPLSRSSRSSSCMGWIVLPRCCGGSGRAAGRQARRVITPPRQFTSPSHTPDRCRRRRRRCRCCAGRWWGCALSAPARCTSGRSAPQRCTPRRAADLRLPAAVSGPGRARGGRGRGSCFDSR
jgi:hypothetical protein